MRLFIAGTGKAWSDQAAVLAKDEEQARALLLHTCAVGEPLREIDLDAAEAQVLLTRPAGDVL